MNTDEVIQHLENVKEYFEAQRDICPDETNKGTYKALCIAIQVLTEVENARWDMGMYCVSCVSSYNLITQAPCNKCSNINCGRESQWKYRFDVALNGEGVQK